MAAAGLWQRAHTAESASEAGEEASSSAVKTRRLRDMEAISTTGVSFLMGLGLGALGCFGFLGGFGESDSSE